jgi:hypothetical protein
LRYERKILGGLERACGDMRVREADREAIKVMVEP